MNNPMYLVVLTFHDVDGIHAVEKLEIMDSKKVFHLVNDMLDGQKYVGIVIYELGDLVMNRYGESNLNG